MRTRALALLAVCCAFAVACWGQTPSASLQENITIRLTGSIGDNTPLDMRLTGAGPDFRCSLAEPALRINYRLEQGPDAKYILTHDIKMQVPVAVAGPTVPTAEGRPARVACQFTDIGIMGRVIIKLDEEIRIATINGKDLVLAIFRTKPAK